MPSDNSPEIPVRKVIAPSPFGAGILAVVVVALVGICLLNSPPRFSDKHLQDTSLLRSVVDALALGGKFPTARGVEIRNLVFCLGAATLAILAGMHLLLGQVRTRLSLEDLLEFRDRAASPFFWWIVLVAVSFLASMFSHAPEVCQGQTILRVLQLAWWWPIAALLPSKYARTLCTALACSLGLTAVVGLWYHVARVLPDVPSARMRYPIGNELWLAACLLPGVFLSAGVLTSRSAQRPHQPVARHDILIKAFLLVAGISTVAALVLTRSRSAVIGVAAGLCTIILLYCSRKRRWTVALVLLLLMSLAVIALQQVRTEGSVGQRAHSIRARLDYEWPYAIRLFFEKPVGGNGDGAYSVLAGQFAREDQLDDPSIMRLDETSWPSHAHNEFLELLADVGLVGVIAFLLALAIPLYRAMQYCDHLRDTPAAVGNRRLAMFSAAAFMAMVVEACGTPAIREPGAMPIFLTVWACLWALVREETPQRPTIPDEMPLARPTVRLFGAAVCFAALLLGHRGIQDWLAARAYFETGRRMEQADFSDAVAQSDFAAAHTLDPFRRSLAAMYAIMARSQSFDQLLAAGPEAPTNEQLEITSEALARLNRLKQAAPRFLRVSRLEAELELNRARAYQRRGESANEAHCQERFLLALRQAREDEPFLIERVEHLWVVDAGASLTDRLSWLRSLMRGGEVEARFLPLVQRLLGMSGVGEALELLHRTADHDLPLLPSQWNDRLSPESWRLLAMIHAVSGQLPQAISLAQNARRMYEAAGPRLFAGHSAAIHEEVRYLFSSDPIDQTEACLDLLAQAFAVAYGPADRDTILQDVALGRTRAIVLLSAQREAEARDQLKAIFPRAMIQSPDLTAGRDPYDVALAGLYLELANSLLNGDRYIQRGVAGCHRALELVPDLPDAWFLLIRAHLAAGEDEASRSAMERFLEIAPDRTLAIEGLRRLRAQYSDRSVWADLEHRFPELTPAPPPGSSQ